MYSGRRETYDAGGLPLKTILIVFAIGFAVGTFGGQALLCFLGGLFGQCW